MDHEIDLVLVTIILSFIWIRIELVAQKISEHRARAVLFCEVFVPVCMCVCVVCMHTWNNDMKQFHGPQSTAIWSHKLSNSLLRLWSWESLKFESCENILEINICIICKYFPLFHRLYFQYFFSGFLCGTKLLCLIRSHLFIFALFPLF